MAQDETDPWTIRQVVVHKNTPNAKVKWELWGGANVFGRPVRRYFDKKSDATKKARELAKEFRAHGSKATELSDQQRADTVRALALLGDRTATLVTAVEFFLKHGPKPKSKNIKVAVYEFLETRGVSQKEVDNPGKHREPEARKKHHKGYTWKHRVNITSRLRTFAKAWGKEPISVAALQQVELQKWLETNFKSHLTALENHRRTIHSLFEWAIAQRLTSENPAKRWRELSKLLKDHKKRNRPGILTVAQLGKLLRAAMSDDPELLPFLVLGAFSGIRTEELGGGPTWSLVRDEIIHIPAWLSKTGDDRDIKIHPTLQAWLKFIKRGSPEAKIVPNDYRQRRAALCKKIKLKWPQNALRHSFGSYRYADTQNMAATSFEMRHEDERIFKQHYLNRGISKAMAAEYWALRPEDLHRSSPV